MKNIESSVLNILLSDRSTKKNIVWATNDYMIYGNNYLPEREILAEYITGINSRIILPRIAKARDAQSNRTRNKAEVFTPLWICNAQNNLVDEQWFGRSDVFNISDNKKWNAFSEKIVFPTKNNKTWKDYVRAKRLEITCGEAPYLVSRYDTVSGEIINELIQRIGILDRKLRIVDENTDDYTNWFKWVKKAYQSTYGYEYQGDNLLIARTNLLYTFCDYLSAKFNRKAYVSELKQIANIISWNIWQMDGLTYTSPYSNTTIKEQTWQMTIFEEEVETSTEYAVPCVVRDWYAKCYVEFRSLINK